MTGVPPGDVRVRAGGGSSGIGRARVAVGVGLSTTQDVHLARGRGIVGRVLLPAGASAEGWRVEFEAHNGSWADSVEVRKNSTFEFANLPATRGRLLLWSQLSHPLPIAVQDVIEVGRPDVIFDLVATGMPGSVLRGRVGQMVENRVAIWHVASGRCTVRDAPPGGQFEFTGLAPGEYRLRAWLPTVGTLDLGGRWIDGTSEVDLGDLRFPEHAQVRVEWPEEPVEVECYRVGDDVDVRHPTWLTSGHGFELAAGRWFLLWREHGTLRMRRFETRAGEGAEVSLLPDPR